MGLILLKDRDGAYRRTWYAVQSINGKRTRELCSLQAENAAIAAIAAANMNGAGSITTQNTPVFSGDRLPQIAL